MAHNFFSSGLLEWYGQHKRDLPWRGIKDPYKIWLSEIILQQTRVKQGLPYYLRFVENFPTVIQLAQAEETKVLRLWQGLGYYSRARNLHKCAKLICDKYNSFFPSSFQELQKLPGIGRYTAAAIASFAFGERVPVVDGNVYRVLSRVFGIETDISSPRAYKEFFDVAGQLMPREESGDFNQALMDFGATHCMPKNPLCNTCTLALHCTAYQNQWQDRLPVKSKKIKTRERFFAYFVLESNDQILMRQREADDIWGKLYDFYLVESGRRKELDEVIDGHAFLRDMILEAPLIEESTNYKHILTHQVIHATFYRVKFSGSFPLSNLPKNLLPYSVQSIKTLPKPILIEKYLNAYIF